MKLRQITGEIEGRARVTVSGTNEGVGFLGTAYMMGEARWCWYVAPNTKKGRYNGS